MKKFNNIVEEVKELTLDEKEELHQLLGKYLIEVREGEVHSNYKKSKKEKGLKFSLSVKDLKSLL